MLREARIPIFPTLEQNVNCRKGLGTEYAVVTSGLMVSVIEVSGRSADSQWLYGMVLGAWCWIYSGVGKLNVAVVTLPIRPVAVKTSIPSVCQSYITQASCLVHKGLCQWTLSLSGPGMCMERLKGG